MNEMIPLLELEADGNEEVVKPRERMNNAQCQ
jgi:hypothetical protein